MSRTAPDIDLRPDHWLVVRDVLRRYVPDRKVLAFGSRASWTAKEYSDLDLAIIGNEPLPLDTGAALAESFAESDLPFKVDLVDWANIDETFRDIIRRSGVEVQAPLKHSGKADSARQSVDEKWRRMSFSEAVVINPAVRLERGMAYPFVDMAAVIAGSRCVHAVEQRTYSGGGSRFQCGDTLMARITPCLENGKIARYCADRSAESAHGSTEFIVIRGRTGVTDTEYAYYLTQWEEVRRYAIDQMTGTSGRPRVPVSSLGYLSVPVPPLPEQRAIAGILGVLDDKIALNRRMNETLEAMARAIFKDWFVDFGPVRAKMEGRAPYLSSGIWKLFPDALDKEDKPVGWMPYTLSELAKHHRATLSPSAKPELIYEHYSIPAYDAGNEPTIELGGSIKSNKTIVPEGAVLLSKLNPEIERVWLPNLNGKVPPIASTEFLALTPLAPATRNVLYCLFRSSSFRAEMTARVTGTSKSHQRVPPKSLLACEVLAANPRLLALFDRTVSSMMDRLLSNRRESRELAQTRDLLIPKLMSGEIRLRDAEKAVEAVA